MGISIKNIEAEQVIRELATELDATLTDAIYFAVAEKLTALRAESEQSMQIDIAAALQLCRKISNRPVLDDRTPEDMLYDDKGIPQ